LSNQNVEKSKCINVTKKNIDKLSDQTIRIQIIKEMEKADFSMHVDAQSIRNKLNNSEIIESLIKLKIAGIKVDRELIENIIPQKINDDFISAFIYLQNNGINVTASLVDFIEWEKISPQYLKTIVQLKELGVNGTEAVLFPSEKVTYQFTQVLHRLLNGGFTSHDEDCLEDEFSSYNFFYDPKKLISIKNAPHATSSSRKLLTKWITPLLLYAVRDINDLHDESDSKRIEVIKDYPVELIYETIVLGNEEVFTSTFKILFDQALIPKLKSHPEYKGNGYELLNKLNFEGMRVFLRTCAQYDKLDRFLSTMTSVQQIEILEKFSENLDITNRPLAEAVTLGESFNILKGKTETLQILESKIKSEYERFEKSNPDTAKLYGLIASIHANASISNQSWFREMQKKYILPDLSQIESKELFNQKKLNIQQHFFYDDTMGEESSPNKWDGHNSFRHFVEHYGGRVQWNKTGKNIQVSGRGKDGWKIEDRGSYVLLKKTEKNGRRMEIYANKPDHEEDGTADIQNKFEDMNLQSIVVVHRGHSYHVKKTIEKIPDIARIVNLGSCGGFNNITSVLERAPDAHILVTKGMGSMFVNDVLFKQINEQILSNRSLYWSTVWKKATRDFKLDKSVKGKKAARYFKNYVAPHQNIGTQIIRAYNDFSSV